MIRIKTELQNWLVDSITNAIHGLEAGKSDEFNKWAKNFEREEANFVVNMEFGNDWGYDEREEVTEEEAAEYAQMLIRKILDNWNL